MKLFDIMDTAFDNYDDTVRKYLSKALNLLGLNYSHNQIFGVIFDGVKGIMQNLMFYIEDAFTEQNIFTAQRKKSIYSLAKISGYEPYYGSAATGTIIGESHISNPLASGSTKIYIPNGVKITNLKTGLKYLTLLGTDYYVVDLEKPLIKHEFEVIQGTWITARFAAEGYAMETFHLNTEVLFDRDYVTVKVNGISWSPRACLYDMSNNAMEYVITTGYDNSLDIMFGNGAYGRCLSNGDTISVTYLSHSGTTGNISPEDSSSFIFDGLGTDSYGNAIDLNQYMTLSLNNYITGGTNSDSITVVRSMIGYNSRSLVLANTQNFELFLRRFSFISYVNIWSQENSMTLTACCLSNNYTNYNTPDEYFNADLSDMFITEDQKQMIITTLENSRRTFAGVTLDFIDPILRNYAIMVYVKSSATYNKDSIKQGIKDILGTKFMELGINTGFVSRSELISLIQEYSNDILSVDLYIISELAEQTFVTGYYDKETLQFVNGVYSYKYTRVMYETNSQPGLDKFGNIELLNEMEIPILHGGFKYYPNKSDDDRYTSITLDPVTIYFSD